MRGAALRAAVLAAEPGPKDLLTTVERALEALETMADSPVPVPAKAVAQRLGISLGTSYRVLHTLEHSGYVVRLGHGCFGFSGKSASLTRQFQDGLDVVGAFRPALKRLAERDGAGRLPRDPARRGGRRRRGHRGREGPARRGARHRVHARRPRVGPRQGAPGRPPRRGDRRLPGAAADGGADPAHPGGAARDQGRPGGVREAGVGHDLEEVALGCCCVAAPVWDPRGAVVGSMGISVPAERWHREGARLTRICRSAAAQASGFGPARAGGRARDGRSARPAGVRRPPPLRRDASARGGGYVPWVGCRRSHT